MKQKNYRSSAGDKLLRLGHFWALQNFTVKKEALDQVPSGAENNWAIADFAVSSPKKKNHSFHLELHLINSTYREYLNIKMQRNVLTSSVIKVKKCEK